MKRLRKKRYCHRGCGEVNSLNSIDSDTSYNIHMIKFFQIHGSVGKVYSKEPESTCVDTSKHVSHDSIESLYSEILLSWHLWPTDARDMISSTSYSWIADPGAAHE